jgi:endonuclease/exonuclease/phosphatase (EEP) superfamily protein YafD
LGGLLEVVGSAMAVATVAGFFGHSWWVLDLAAHFRVQYAAGLLLLALGSLGMRCWRRALLWGALGMLNAGLVAPAFRVSAQAIEAAGPRLRLVLTNVHTANRRFEDLLALVRETSPDLLLLVEVDDAWMRALEPLAPEYPWRVASPRSDNFGIAFFSRIPLADVRVLEIGPAEVPSVLASFDWQGRSVTLLGTHPLPPISADYAAARDGQLAAAARLLAEANGPRILLGDLNTSPWGHAFHDLVRTSGLRDTAEGWGWQPTWPAHNLLLRLPLDHALISSDWVVLRRTVGPSLGSDHFPLILDLGFEEVASVRPALLSRRSPVKAE